MSGPPYHITARKGEVAERVIVVGDPARAEQLSRKLENPKLVSTNRGMPVYTGEYNGVGVSVATHGMGGPSAMIVFEELYMLGAKVMVRLGSTGGLLPEIEEGEIIIPTVATYLNTYGVLAAYAPGVCLPSAPSFDVLSKLVEKARELGVKHRIGPVLSNDAFYSESPDFAEFWRKKGAISVEMECAALFALGHLRGFKTGAALVVSNNVVRETPLLRAEQLREYVEKAGELVLKAITEVTP